MEGCLSKMQKSEQLLHYKKNTTTPFKYILQM